MMHDASTRGTCSVCIRCWKMSPNNDPSKLRDTERTPPPGYELNVGIMLCTSSHPVDLFDHFTWFRVMDNIIYIYYYIIYIILYYIYIINIIYCCYYDTAPITATMKTRTVLAVLEPKVGIYQNENVGMTHDNRSTKWSIYTWQRGSHCVWFFNSPLETWRSRKVMVFCIIPISS